MFSFPINDEAEYACTLTHSDFGSKLKDEIQLQNAWQGHHYVGLGWGVRQRKKVP